MPYWKAELSLIQTKIKLFEDVLEKGIMVNGIKIPMRGDTTQFTILADVDGEYIGYAILRDGTSFIEVTDGKVEIKAE